MKTLIVIPAYNEKDNIERVVETLSKISHSMIMWWLTTAAPT